jgi:hypothetical protein
VKVSVVDTAPDLARRDQCAMLEFNDRRGVPAPQKRRYGFPQGRQLSECRVIKPCERKLVSLRKNQKPTPNEGAERGYDDEGRAFKKWNIPRCSAVRSGLRTERAESADSLGLRREHSGMPLLKWGHLA